MVYFLKKDLDFGLLLRTQGFTSVGLHHEADTRSELVKWLCTSIGLRLLLDESMLKKAKLMIKFAELEGENFSNLGGYLTGLCESGIN